MGIQRRGPFQCPICYDTIKQPSLLRECEHAFCYDCINQWLETQKQDPSCPFCRQKVNMKKEPVIRIKPKYDGVELTRHQTSTTSLEELHKKLIAETTALENEEAEYNTAEQKYRIELDTLKRQIEEARQKVKPIQDKLDGREKEIDYMRRKLTQTSPHFDSIYAEVINNPIRLKDMEPVDNIKTAWETARSHYQRHDDLQDKIREARKQIKEKNVRNQLARISFQKIGPEELSQRLSKPIFENLCAFMDWDSRLYVTATELDDDLPIYLEKRPRLSALASNKEPTLAEKIGSFFDDDLLNMDLF